MRKLLFLLLTVPMISFVSCDSSQNYINRTSSSKDIEYYRLTEQTVLDDNGTIITISVPQYFNEQGPQENQLAAFNYIENKNGYYISIDKLESRNTIKTTNKEYIDIMNTHIQEEYGGDLNKMKHMFPKAVFKDIELFDFEGNLIINNKYFAKRKAYYIDARNDGSDLEDVPLIEFQYITHHNKRKYTISIVRYGNNSISDMIGLANTIGGSIKFK